MTFGDRIQQAFDESNAEELRRLNREIAKAGKNLDELRNRRDELLGNVSDRFKCISHRHPAYDRLLADVEAA